MPLLPGESHDKYEGGLSFFYDIEKSIKGAAQRVQDGIEKSYRELSSSFAGDLGASSAITPGHTLGFHHVVPVPTNWDDTTLIPFTILPALSNVCLAIREGGDPLMAAPGTTLLAAGSVFVFSRSVPVRHWCLLPHMIVYEGEVFRLLTPTLLHRNVPHLISNMSNLICLGLHLERGRGWKFLGEVLALTITANLLRLASMTMRAYSAGRSLRSMPISIYGALGFSATCLALQVVSQHGSRRVGQRSVETPALPGEWKQMTCWVSYCIHGLFNYHHTQTSGGGASSSLRMLQADLEYDLCGIVAGVSFVWGPKLIDSFREARNLRAWARTIGGGERLGGGVASGGGGRGAQQRATSQGVGGEMAVARDARARAVSASAAAPSAPAASRGSFIGGTGGGVRLGSRSEADLEIRIAGMELWIHPVYLHMALALTSWIALRRLA